MFEKVLNMLFTVIPNLELFSPSSHQTNRNLKQLCSILGFNVSFKISFDIKIGPNAKHSKRKMTPFKKFSTDEVAVHCITLDFMAITGFGVL